MCVRLTSLKMVNFSNSERVEMEYLQASTHDRGRDRTERILQAEEQILERMEEEPYISTRRLTAEIGVS